MRALLLAVMLTAGCVERPDVDPVDMAETAAPPIREIGPLDTLATFRGSVNSTIANINKTLLNVNSTITNILESNAITRKRLDVMGQRLSALEGISPQRQRRWEDDKWDGSTVWMRELPNGELECKTTPTQGIYVKDGEIIGSFAEGLFTFGKEYALPSGIPPHCRKPELKLLEAKP